MIVTEDTAPETLKTGPDPQLPPSPTHDSYHRYHIEVKPAPNVAPHPNRFHVKVKKHGLAPFLLKEIIHYRGNMAVATSRPCIYGVFSGPVGGFSPRPHECVGCLRCTMEHAEIVQVYHNPEREHLGDSFFTPDHVDTIAYEAQTGRVPVKGAGYRGRFGGENWDGMWTDMSEIVRPTRDGIHGREFISTGVDIAEKPSLLTFDDRGFPTGPLPRALSIPLPILFDVPPPSVTSQTLLAIFGEAARETETLAIVPFAAIERFRLDTRHIVPLVTLEDAVRLSDLRSEPPMIELAAWNEEVVSQIRTRFPTSIPCLRLDYGPGFGEKLVEYARAGARVFHLVADFHGRGEEGRFALDLISEAHKVFVDAGCRDEVTLLGSGGIIAAEHVPKAIICGLDAVALDTPLLVALQAQMVGQCADRETSAFQLPGMEMEWGVQRLKNLLASWRDQLLEVLGAMGLREVRRLRGEVGRAMFLKDLEREVFGGITGYDIG